MTISFLFADLGPKHLEEGEGLNPFPMEFLATGSLRLVKTRFAQGLPLVWSEPNL